MTTTTAAPTARAAEDQRERFYRLIPQLLREDPRLALVLAEIGAGYLDPAVTAPVADRVVNVGIREQLLLGVAGGLAMTGMRPIVHTFPPFLIERPFEQVKLDLGHQGVGAVLVSAGGSYGWPSGGQTHFGHRDVALLDTVDGWTVHGARPPGRGRQAAAPGRGRPGPGLSAPGQQRQCAAARRGHRANERAAPRQHRHRRGGRPNG
ncbi:MAG: hypothetical protein WCC38_05850 [Pseudonocardiaceae bacterium]